MINYNRLCRFILAAIKTLSLSRSLDLMHSSAHIYEHKHINIRSQTMQYLKYTMITKRYGHKYVRNSFGILLFTFWLFRCLLISFALIFLCSFPSVLFFILPFVVFLILRLYHSSERLYYDSHSCIVKL